MTRVIDASKMRNFKDTFYDKNEKNETGTHPVIHYFSESGKKSLNNH